MTRRVHRSAGFLLLVAAATHLANGGGTADIFGTIATAEEPSNVNTTFPELLEQLRSPEREIRLQAAAALTHRTLDTAERHHAQRAVLEIVRNEPMSDPQVIEELIRALDRWGVDMTAVLIHAVRDNDQVLSFAIARSIRDRNPRKIAAELVPMLRHSSAETRLLAIEIAGILKLAEPDALAALRNGLQDRNSRVRFRSIAALGRSGDRSAETRAALAAAENDESPQVAAQAKSVLQSFPPVSANQTISAETTGAGDASRPDVQQQPADRSLPSAAQETAAVQEDPAQAVQSPERSDGIIAAVVQPPASVPAPQPPALDAKARAALKDERGSEQLKALLELDGSDRKTTPLLVRSLASQDAEIRAAAAMKAAELRQDDPKILAALGRALNDGDPRVRFAAGFALRQTGDAGIAVLGKAAKDPDRAVRLNTVQSLAALKPLPPAALPILEEALARDTDRLVRLQAALAVLPIRGRDQHAVRILVEALPSANGDLRMKILQALRTANQELVFTSLEEETRSSSPLLRRESVLAMAELDPASDRTLAAIRLLANDSEETVRRAAKRAEEYAR